jgi:hypothetical protein
MTRLFAQLRQAFKVSKLGASLLAWKATSLCSCFESMEPRLIKRRVVLWLGLPGLVAGGLLTACAVFYVSTISQAEAHLASVRNRMLAAQEQARRGARESVSLQGTPEEQLARFYSLFPPNDDLPQRMETIFSSAQKQGLGLEQGEYKVMRDSDGGLVRFQMTFPVKGDYPRIRRYLTSLMADIPTLALQKVQFKRERVGDATVDADIKLVLYLLEQKS